MAGAGSHMCARFAWAVTALSTMCRVVVVPPRAMIARIIATIAAVRQVAGAQRDKEEATRERITAAMAARTPATGGERGITHPVVVAVVAVVVYIVEAARPIALTWRWSRP